MPIDNGNYTVEHVEVGEVKIGVNTNAGRGQMMSATMAAAQTKDQIAKAIFRRLAQAVPRPNYIGPNFTVTQAQGVTEHDIKID